MKFLVCMTQHGYGCDYTIGCGMRYDVIEADSREDVIETVLYPDGRDEGSYYLSRTSDTELKELIITELADDYVLLAPYKEAYIKQQDAIAEAEEKLKRHEEYLKLQEEFGEE